MFKIFVKHEHNLEMPDFSRAGEDKSYPFDELTVGDFLEIYIDDHKDWDQEVMYEHDVVFYLNEKAAGSKSFRHQPLRNERVIRVWPVK